MQAILRPLKQKHEAQLVRLVARTGRDRIKVEVELATGKKRIFAADRFRLFSTEDRRVPVSRHLLDTLDWQGAGPDPLLVSPSATAAADGEALSLGDL